MHVCLIAYLLKLLASVMFFCEPIQVSQDGFMLRLICMFLGCDLPMQLLLKLLSSTYKARLVDRLIKEERRHK